MAVLPVCQGGNKVCRSPPCRPSGPQPGDVRQLVDQPGGHQQQNVPADAAGRSAVPGVWVAGNVADLTAQVGAAAAAGASAAAQINADLVAEETRQAVAAHREARVSELATGDRRQ